MNLVKLILMIMLLISLIGIVTVAERIAKIKKVNKFRRGLKVGDYCKFKLLGRMEIGQIKEMPKGRNTFYVIRSTGLNYQKFLYEIYP